MIQQIANQLLIKLGEKMTMMVLNGDTSHLFCALGHLVYADSYL